MFRSLNNFSYIDKKFFIEAFKASLYAFSALKEVIFLPFTLIFVQNFKQFQLHRQ